MKRASTITAEQEQAPAAQHKKLSAIDAIVGRRSVRQFLDTPVSENVIMEILDIASRAPSGTNVQPWTVHVVSGAARERLSNAVLEGAREGRRSLEYPYLANPMSEPHISRRRKVAYELYGLYGIERDDIEGRKWAELRNFEFFGAPVGMFFVLDRSLTHGSWLDCGMFMQNIMISARSFGLETCPQQSWCDYGEIVHSILQIPASQIIVSGMAIGYADEAARVNLLRSERVAAGEFTTIHRS